jgi:hypothetical protein
MSRDDLAFATSAEARKHEEAKRADRRTPELEELGADGTQPIERLELLPEVPPCPYRRL